jgi:hypothetical protein
MTNRMIPLVLLVSLGALLGTVVDAEIPQVNSCGEYRVTGTIICESNAFCEIVGSKGSLSEFRLKFASSQNGYSILSHARVEGAVRVVQKSSPPSITVLSLKRIAPVPNKGDQLVFVKAKECQQ